MGMALLRLLSGTLGLAPLLRSEDPLAILLFLVTGRDIQLITLLCIAEHLFCEAIDVLSVELWPNQMDLIFIGHSQKALAGRGTPLHHVNNPIRQSVLSDHFARACVPYHQVMCLIARCQKESVRTDGYRPYSCLMKVELY